MLIHILFSGCLFTIGLCGLFLARKNIILILMSLEILLLAANYNYLLCSIFLDDLVGEIFSLLLLAVGGSESALGLALAISYYRGGKYI